MSIRSNKIAGSVYGFAIGDAMGATTEFMTADQIACHYDKITEIIGGGWLRLRPGQVTDDTQMMMCVMDAAMVSGGNEDKFRDECIRNFIEWYNSNPPDVGAQCARGIHAMLSRAPIGFTASAGNGSLMRALPCALLDWKRQNQLQGKLTHMNNECFAAIDWYHDAIQAALNGDKWKRFENDYLVEPTGYVKDTLNNVKVWAAESTFERCIIGAVNHGGDADTIAAIAGGLAGAMFGYDAIPRKWIDKLDPNVKMKLDNFVAFCVKEA